jgi:hypothetical protein
VLNLKAGDFMSEEIDGPVGVIELNKPVIRIIKSLTATSGTGTIFTSASDKDTYLSCIVLSASKTAAESGTTASITCVLDGVTSTIAVIASVTLTADLQTIVVPLPVPIKVDRNTVVAYNIGGTWINIRCSVMAYVEEVTK